MRNFENKNKSYKTEQKPCQAHCEGVLVNKNKSKIKKRLHTLFVFGLFFFAVVFCVSAIFIAPNKMTPQTTTPIPVNALEPNGDCGEGATYKFENGLLTISVKTGYTSGAIADNAFKSPTGADIVTVVINEGITSIGKSAFYSCSSLTSITIPNSVTSIGGAVFYSCSSLTSITIPDGVTSIGNSAFHGCKSLASITIPNSVTSIGGAAFHSCESLTSITIPNSVTSIGSYAFQNCSRLTSITIPNSVTSIGDSTFYDCSSLTSITIPDGVTSIGNYVFYSCSRLTSVTIPNSVTSIGNYAFSSCSSLTSITIPDGVTSIGNYVFYGCKSLTSITIPDNVTSIGSNAFNGCSRLTSVTIPNSVTSIGNYAFKDCSKLASVTISDNVTSIGSSAFSSCSADLIICGSGNKESTAYNYAQSNQINYATAWVKKDSATHTRTFYGFKTDSSATAVTQIESHNFGADGMAETCSVCGAKNDNVIITLNIITNVSRYFVIYVLESDNQPTRQFVVTNGDTIVFTMAKSSTFTIQVYETLYMRAKIDAVDTLKQKYENLTEHKTIAIDISGVTNVNNWVMI